MPMQKDIHYLHDADGRLVAVQINISLWQKLKQYLPETEEKSLPASDMEAFAEFISAWNFPYAYMPLVQCPHCHTQTQDWRKNGAFVLKNANLGGLLVFSCTRCGAIVRQKYFKDHIAYEFTPPAP